MPLSVLACVVACYFDGGTHERLEFTHSSRTGARNLLTVKQFVLRVGLQSQRQPAELILLIHGNPPAAAQASLNGGSVLSS